MELNNSSHVGVGTGKISVAYFMNTEVRAGVENHVLSFLRRLNRDLFRLCVIAPPRLCALYGKDLPEDVAVLPLRLAQFSDWKAMRTLVAFLHSHRIDILHSHPFYASVFASPLGRLAGVPLIVETPHVREQWRKGWIKGRFLVDRWVARCVNRFIAVSHANARYLIEVKGFDPKKMVVIHNGRNLERFQPSAFSEESRVRARRKLGFSPADPVISVLARLEPQKGHGILLDALPGIVKRFPHLKMCFVGEGALRRQLEQRVKQENMESVVRFVGYQADVLPWIGMADLVVLSSFYEGLPLVAIEALAMEKPVVATAVDGTPEVVQNGKTGLTVPPGNPIALENAINRLLGNRGLRMSLGKAGRQLVLQEFTEEMQVVRTEEFYFQALQQCRKRSGVMWPQLAEKRSNAETVSQRVAGQPRVEY